ncbi:E3 ubiquitin-protein ligase RNF31, partial [Frankliniella fusca]
SGAVSQQASVEQGRGQLDSPPKRDRWQRRARGFFVRALAILCFRPRRATGNLVLAASPRPQTA